METQQADIMANKVRQFEYYDYLDQQDESGVSRKDKIVESLTPEQLHLLHNMRTMAVVGKLMLNPEASDFKANWHIFTGQIAILTTLIGE
jgi:hypothetical protein